MSSSVLIFGASGYIGLGVALAMRRAGYQVYGMIRNEKHCATLIQHEIEPIVASSFDDVQPVANILASCSIIIDAVGFNPKLSPILLEAALHAGRDRTENGKLVHYAPLFIFTSGIMTFIQGRRDMRWSWVHIDDLAEGYVAVIRAPRSVVDGQLYNIAAPNDNPTYEELRTAMAKAQGRKEKIEYKEADGNVPSRWDTDSIINPAKAMNELGWRPRHVGFVEEIDTYYKAWAAHKAAHNAAK
ncbi:unnamed protein product [Rotaria sp. Silwood1]|nr:unnamed protein product [Rotaria sp. Silwood1]CAF1411116.1 unnamed protein product [Rotaria sp. Silwood1]CAF3528669.1 unnamed protein product [Rotaria sp. Silwood1]CAF3588424.1 unnamed protein product [Rotaria sp. Silwood1]CAF4882557.1 unnamed protein product [Rotaria sp. Silwood1]